MLLEIFFVILGAITSGLSTVIAGLYVMRKTKNDIKEEVFDYLQSQEGINQFATLGAAFGAGLMTRLKLGKGVGKGFKFMGLTIPQTVVDAVITNIAGRVLPKSTQGAGVLGEIGKT